MDSTFLGVLAGFGLANNPDAAPDKREIELLNPSARVRELLDNLGVLSLFNVATLALQMPADTRVSSPDTIQSDAGTNHPHLSGRAPDADGPQPGERRAVQGRDAVSRRGFEEPGKFLVNEA